jgi:hypothetical protein
MPNDNNNPTASDAIHLNTIISSEIENNFLVKTFVRPLLFEIDPYLDFDDSSFDLELQGWGSESDAFREIVEAVRPSLIIEVGSWKGASAVTMAKACDALELPTEIVCIDTWLGAPEFWQQHSDTERYISLRLQNGYPSVYYQFLANIQKSGHATRITPMPLSSTAAATFLSKNKIKAGMIYIDANHETNDVLLDMAAFFPLLEMGGVLFGDDMDGAWPSVERAVHLFAARNNLHYEVKRGRYWVIRKTSEFNPLDVQAMYEMSVPTTTSTEQIGPLHRLAERFLVSRVYYPYEEFTAAAMHDGALMVHPPLRRDAEIQPAEITAMGVPAAPRSVLTGSIAASDPRRQVTVTALLTLKNEDGISRQFSFPLLPGFMETRFNVPLKLSGESAEKVSVSFSSVGPPDQVAACCAVSWSNLEIKI